MQRSSSPDIHELQALAATAARTPRRRKPRLSRSAKLMLIDVLSRWTGSGLALLAGVTIFLAVSTGRAWPARAVAWAVMVIAALFVCRRLLKAFRAGERSAARPFRWRATYTAALSVLSAAFGAGALILIPESAPGALVSQTLLLVLVGAFGAGVLHAAHGRAVAAICGPALVFVFIGAWRVGGLAFASTWIGAAALTGAAALYLFQRYVAGRAAHRFPRTGFARREIELDETSDDADYAAAASA